MTINVLIADDSKVVTQLLDNILSSQPDIHIVGHAANGEEAVELTQRLKPDLITMDVLMPKMDGVEATRIIMQKTPTPIIVISSFANASDMNITFNALQAGALSIIQKPPLLSDEGFEQIKRQIINEVRALASVRVVRRGMIKPAKPEINSAIKMSNYELLCLGCSTGGPVALNIILSVLPKDFPIPIVITQHITPGFLPGLIKWLQSSSELTLQIAKSYQKLVPGNVYFAPDNKHLLINKKDGPIAILQDSNPINFFKPSATVLFSSIAKSYPGKAIGGLLTGMGRDGAEGLLEMRKAGCFTFAQSEKSSVVYGMPGAAASMDAVNCLVDLEEIPKFLAKLTCTGEIK